MSVGDTIPHLKTLDSEDSVCLRHEAAAQLRGPRLKKNCDSPKDGNFSPLDVALYSRKKDSLDTPLS